MIFYATKDIERAAGIDLERYPDVYLIANRSPLADLLLKKYPERITLNDKGVLSTFELLKHFDSIIDTVNETRRQNHSNYPRNVRTIKSSVPRILVFKNSLQIERLCHEQGWQLLNPPAELSHKFERKISQYQWLSQLTVRSYKLPVTITGNLGDFNFNNLVTRIGQPLILQYNIGHTGSGTKLISNSSELENEKQKFPKREVRISQYIKGRAYTINACVIHTPPHALPLKRGGLRGGAMQRQSQKECSVICGRTSEQLTGLSEYTDNQLATVGNDWGAVSEEINAAVIGVAVKVGEYMARDGWKGLFGIDVIVEDKTDDIYLIEINARQPASSTFETQLAHLQGADGPMDCHLAALLGTSYQLPASREKRGEPVTSYQLNASQVFLRKTSGPLYERFGHLTKVGEYSRDLELIEEKPVFDLSPDSGNIFIILQPADLGSEVLRIQTNTSFNKLKL